MPVFQVFLSSTFRDMEQERDALSRVVMPRLGKKCAGRGVEFSFIDLRWGIDDDLAAQGEIVQHCIARIDATVPVFFGMVGARYGSCLPYRDNPGLSATHHEFRRGLASDKTLIFMVRDTDDSRAAHQQQPDMLKMLEEIPPRFRTDYTSIEEFITLADKQLMDALDRFYPARALPDPMAEATARQDRQMRIAQSRLSGLRDGDVGQRWSENFEKIAGLSYDDEVFPFGICPVIARTAGDCDLLAVEFAAWLRHHLPAGDLVFTHAIMAERDRSAAWAMRRLLAYIIAQTGDDMGAGAVGGLSDAQVQVYLNTALAELLQKRRHLHVVLSRADAVELQLYMRPLLIAPICSVVLVLSKDDAVTLPASVSGITAPAPDGAARRAIIGTVAQRADKARALSAAATDVLAASPLGTTLTGTLLLADALVAWGDLKPEDCASQDAWLLGEVQRLAAIATLPELSQDIIRAVARVLDGIVPDFAALAGLALDCLSASPVALDLGEVVQIAGKLATARALVVETRQIPLVLSYLTSAMSAVDEDMQTYRLTDKSLWHAPADMHILHTLILQVLTGATPDRRRAEGAARCAHATMQEADRRLLLSAPGFAALMDISFLTPLAAGLEGAIGHKRAALIAAAEGTAQERLVDDCLAFIAALSGHDAQGCTELAETLQPYLRGAGAGPSRALAAAAQLSLDQIFADMDLEARSLGAGAGMVKITQALRSVTQVHVHDPNMQPREQYDFLRNYAVMRNEAMAVQPFGLITAVNDLRTMCALDISGQIAAGAALALARFVLEYLEDRGLAEAMAIDLCRAALGMSIHGEEFQYANRDIALFSNQEALGLAQENISLHSLESAGIVGQRFHEVMTLVADASALPQCTPQFTATALEALVPILAGSDRRMEKTNMMRGLARQSDKAFFEEIWLAHHRATDLRARPGEVMLEALGAIRRVLAHV